MIVLCTPLPRPSGVPGAQPDRCAFCDAGVWVSPSTRALQQRSLLTSYELACPTCMRRKTRFEPITEVAVCHEQAVELKLLLRMTPEEILEPLGIKVTRI